MQKKKEVLVIIEPFVQANFENGTQLDLLELLHAEQQQKWSFTRIKESLKESDKATSDAIEHLVRRGFLRRSGEQEFCYHPRTAFMSALVNLLVLQLKSRRLQIVRMIYANDKT